MDQIQYRMDQIQYRMYQFRIIQEFRIIRARLLRSRSGPSLRVVRGVPNWFGITTALLSSWMMSGRRIALAISVSKGDGAAFGPLAAMIPRIWCT